MKAIKNTNRKLILTHNLKKKNQGLGVFYPISNGKQTHHTQTTQESHTAHLNHKAVSLYQDVDLDAT